MKLVVATILAAAVVAVAVSGVFLLELDSPELGRAALAATGETLGIDLSATGYRWSFRRGLVLEDVEASSVVPGGRLGLRVEELVFEQRLLPLLTGAIVVKRVRLTRPRVKLASLRPSAKSPLRPVQAVGRSLPEKEKREQTEQPGSEFSLEVDEIAIEEGSFLWQRPGGRPDVSLNGLHLDLRGLVYDSRALTPIHGLNATGEIRATSVRWEPIAVRALQGRLEIARGKIEMSSGVLETENGGFNAELGLDFNQLPPGYEVRLSGLWDFQTVMGSDYHVGSAESIGASQIEMEANGFGEGLEHLTAAGTFTLQNGQLPPWPLCNAIDTTLDEPSLVGASYENVTASFRIEAGQVHFHDVELRTDRLDLVLGGTVSFDGPVALKVVVRKPSGRAIPILLTGTMEEPVVVRANR